MSQYEQATNTKKGIGLLTDSTVCTVHKAVTFIHNEDRKYNFNF